MTVYLIIDEAGEKGYSTNIDNENNKFGTIVGYFLFENQINQAREILKKGLAVSTNEKIHITDLQKEQQHIFRETIFNLLKINSTKWIHQSIYNKGFCNFVGEKKSLLHEELFKGLFMKAIAYIYDTTRSKKINLIIISDNIDKSIIKKLKRSVVDIIDMLTGKHEKVKTLRKWDKLEKKVIIHERRLNTELSENIFQLEELTLVADILANSTYYYLNKELTLNQDIKLNSLETLKQHPLVGQVYGCYNSNSKDAIDFFDTIYRKNYNKKTN